MVLIKRVSNQAKTQGSSVNLCVVKSEINLLNPDTKIGRLIGLMKHCDFRHGSTLNDRRRVNEFALLLIEVSV